ncbi:MAG: hypothetical protein R6V58_06650 [Planctomycetota bacterium]
MKITVAASDVPRGMQAVVRYKDGPQMTSVLGPLGQDRVIESPRAISVEIVPAPGFDAGAVTDGEILEKLIEVTGHTRRELELAVRAERKLSGPTYS